MSNNQAIRDRIKDFRRVPASSLVPSESNWRTHPDTQRDALAGLLSELGYCDALLCRETPDGTLHLIDGHLRRETTPNQDVPVLVLDVDEDEAKKLLLTLDPLAALATADTDKLDALLREVETGSEAVAALLTELAEQNDIIPPEGEGGSGEAPEAQVDRADELNEKWQVKRGDLWLIPSMSAPGGVHRLLCGDSTVPQDVARCMGGRKAKLINTDPPYGCNLDTRDRMKAAESADGRRRPSLGREDSAATIDNDELDGEKLQAFLESVIRAAVPWLVDNAAFYLWHPMLTQGTFFAAAAAADILIHRQIIWVKPSLLFGFGDYHWQHELCQPPGTKVLVPGTRDNARYVDIESLRTGDRVVSFDKFSSQVTGLRDGRTVSVGERHYDGKMYEVVVGNASTRATDGHLWSVRLAPEAANLHAVYLMRKGNWWRVGRARILAPYGCGVKWRSKCEGADATWVLSVHDNALNAICAEQVASVKYGIPTTHWRVTSWMGTRTHEHIASIYDRLDLDVMGSNAIRALIDHHRKPEYPFVDRSMYRTKYSRRASMLVRSCNLIPGAMALPLMRSSNDNFEWSQIGEIDVSSYSGTVYSLDVDQFNHYISDGIVTHNCFYGWRRGHRPDFLGERNQTTIWDMRGDPNSERLHPTQKPVELFSRPMTNHLMVGEVAYEPFCGSGSQFVAGEQLGRIVCGMDIEPKYCAVTLERLSEMSLEPRRAK